MLNLGRLRPAHIYFIMATEFTKQKRLMSKQHQYDIDSMKVQAELNRQQWETENEYNLPVNQKQRLMAAGMNPLFNNLDGTSSSLAPVSLSNNVDAAGTYAATNNSKQQKVANMQALAKGFAEIANLNAQTDAAKAQAQNSRHDTLLKDAQANVAHVTATGQSMQNATYQQQFESEQEKRASEIYINKVMAEKGFAEIKQIAKNIDLTDKEIENISNEILNRNKLTDAQVNKLNTAMSLDMALASQAYADGQLKLSSKALNDQLYKFNEKMNPKRVQEIQKTVDNLIKEGNNLIKQGYSIDKVAEWYQKQIDNADMTDSEKMAVTTSMNQDARIGQIFMHTLGAGGVYSAASGALQHGIAHPSTSPSYPNQNSDIYY